MSKVKKNITTVRDTRHVYDLRDPSLPVDVIKIDPPLSVLEVKSADTRLEVILDSERGIRLRTDSLDGNLSTVVEMKNHNGEWYIVSGVQSVSIEMSVDDPEPKITVKRYLLF